MQSGPQDVYVTVDWNMLPEVPMTRRYVPSNPSADALPANPMTAPETTAAVTSVLLMVCMAPPVIPPPRIAANIFLYQVHATSGGVSAELVLFQSRPTSRQGGAA